jgi:hypothetical protein
MCALRAILLGRLALGNYTFLYQAVLFMANLRDQLDD